MKRLTGTITPYIYGVMRIVVGLLFACHGAQKLFGFFGGGIHLRRDTLEHKALGF